MQLNADDPLLFGANLVDEYRGARTHIGPDARLADIGRNSLDRSGAPDLLKVRARTAIDIWYAEDATTESA